MVLSSNITINNGSLTVIEDKEKYIFTWNDIIDSAHEENCTVDFCIDLEDILLKGRINDLCDVMACMISSDDGPQGMKLKFDVRQDLSPFSSCMTTFTCFKTKKEAIEILEKNPENSVSCEIELNKKISLLEKNLESSHSREIELNKKISLLEKNLESSLSREIELKSKIDVLEKNKENVAIIENAIICKTIYDEICIRQVYPGCSYIELENENIDRIIKTIKCIDVLSLTLSYNNIKKIEGLDNLPKLNTLFLRDNKITKIEGLDKLTCLQDLNLSHNQISIIEGLDKLENLQNLYLNDNIICKVENLERQLKLKYLELSNNKITKLPILSHLKELKILSINGNLIETPHYIIYM